MNDTQANSTYSDDSLWSKLGIYARQAGYTVIEKVLWLYYAADNPNVPAKAKAAIYAALAYFISPIDVVPDVIPVVGYSDDLSVLAAAVVAVSFYINDEVKQRARDTLATWFS
ncbi:DUF1232 domain-containing protein [Thiospirillum jenense]|uniref:DUF1232 domain-containing protein n=1 Tax=Thiospirillum jenense TaxID=1653858 RepID=A0A839H9Z8_9GAMM|nr:DUF1232 domain-containing protein [Thiospirillum jenense]MBB1125604.1 DUF1232 domain-containing protein [Thiospirillum jenense]